ncbi:MAG: DsbA family protein [Pyrinomonadaceae bacterium]|nr:DsbA family protein [Pyrinomonadaceae bacterium]
MSKEIKILGGIAIVVIAAAIIGASFYRNSTPVATKPANATPAKSWKENEAFIRDDSPTLGPKDAKVTIVEFLDPECESCAKFHPIVKKALKDYEGKVRLVVRYMPLHPNSLSAATFLEAAGEQGKYWEAQDLLFAKQPEWGTRHGVGHGAPQPDVNALFKKYAGELGLNIEQMNAVYSANKYRAKVERDQKDGQSLGVRQTPTIFVNGVKLARLDDTSLRYLINAGLK